MASRRCWWRRRSAAIERDQGEPEALRVGEATADRDGAFATTVEIPIDTAAGGYRLVIIAANANGADHPWFDCMSRTSGTEFAVTVA